MYHRTRGGVASVEGCFLVVVVERMSGRKNHKEQNDVGMMVVVAQEFCLCPPHTRPAVSGFHRTAPRGSVGPLKMGDCHSKGAVMKTLATYLTLPVRSTTLLVYSALGSGRHPSAPG